MNELSDKLIAGARTRARGGGTSSSSSRPSAAQRPNPPRRPDRARSHTPGTRLSEPKTAEAPSEPSGDSSADPNEQALLRATQLAVSGIGREEIEATLTDEYGVADAAAIVDEILGESR